jgi:hypothetical protein
VGIFAVLYVLAQAIERLIEPLSAVLGGLLDWRKGKGKRVTRKSNLVQIRKTALAKARPGEWNARKMCAEAQDDVNQFRANASPMGFGIATLLAMLGGGYTGFMAMRLVGLTGVWPPVDVLITGLAIGGGTKPLHDLITNLRESKTAKQDPSELQTN